MPRKKKSNPGTRQPATLGTAATRLGTLGIGIGFLVCLAAIFVPAELYPFRFQPLTDLKQETAGVTIASMAIAIIVLTTTGKVDSGPKLWSWMLGVSAYFASILAFQDKHWMGAFVHLVAMVPIVCALMSVSMPRGLTQRAVWFSLWLGSLAAVIILMDSTVYGVAMYHALGPTAYVALGIVAAVFFVTAIMLILSLAGLKAGVEAAKPHIWGKNAR